MLGRAWLLVACTLATANLISGQESSNGFAASSLNASWSLEPVAAQKRWEAIINETGGVLALHEALVVRLSGPAMVPFTLETQNILAKAFQQTVIPNLGPVEIVSYRENYPRPGFSEPADITDPYVDFAGNLYHLFNKSMPNLNVSDTWTQAWTDEFTNFLMWGAKAQTMGLNGTMKLMSININEMLLTKNVRLAPVVPVEAMVAVDTVDGLPLTAEQASGVAQGVSDLLSSHVEIMAWTTPAALALFNATYDYGQGSKLMVLDISLPACDATDGSNGWESCSLASLQVRLLEAMSGSKLAPSLGPLNMTSPRLAGMRLRPTPVPPPQPVKNASVPWHLDRLDQRSLPLDGAYVATGGGDGVNVYILSGGVDATHTEFANPDGTPGTRIRAGWGYNGTDPLQDCPDAFVWYGFGTFAASLIGGNTMGVAKNATMTSVRFRTSCMLESPAIWAPGGLPSAIDAVISTVQHPAVMMIDTWWSPDRLSSDDDEWIEAALKSRLDQAIAANITVVVPAGFGDAPTCDNVFAAHPGTIVATGTDDYDRATIFGATNSSCIDIWAPGGGLGSAVLGAMPNGGFVSVIPRAFSAAWITTGLAAQYLGEHPEATPYEVRAALRSMSTDDVVLMTGTASPNLLGYTNITQNVSSADAQPYGTDGQPQASEGGGLATGAVIGIAVPLGILVILSAVFLTLYALRRQHRLAAAAAMASNIDGDWEIDEKRIEVVCRPGGEPWLLGEGSYGKVVKAVKDGVQVVAVKTLHCSEDQLRDQFVREIAMMRFVSRDANITQFYGAVVGTKSLMLVCEYMEGGDLRKAITADLRHRLAWHAGGKAIALDITRGLHFLHTSRVSHRDIKSSNILLTKDGRAKLGDVGLARILEEQHQSDGFVGTFAWAAPELLMGQRCDERVDIWSLGTVLWEIATQEMPMRGMLRPPLVPEECPQELVDIIHACMEHDPKNRPNAHKVYNMLLAAPPLEGFEDAACIADQTPTTQSPSGSVPSTRQDSSGAAPWAQLGEEGGDLDPFQGWGMSWPLNAMDSTMSAAGRGVQAVARTVSPKLHTMVTQIQQRLRLNEEAAGETSRDPSPSSSKDKGSLHGSNRV